MREHLVSVHSLVALWVCAVDHVPLASQRLTGHSVWCLFKKKKPRTQIYAQMYPTQNTTQNNRVNSHTQNTTALQPNEFFIAMHRLLSQTRGWSVFPSANHSQGQLETLQSPCIIVEDELARICKEVGRQKLSASAGKNGRKKQKGSIMIAKFISEKGNRDMWSTKLKA